ncbi:MAG: DUF1501 domain-containing protein [Xanthomonadales bacterium]|nr:DUF1501 domain-containing protein [Xanthomonadales bacterium]NIN60699.1 DUF1501 domain-containing protein [Xanthomonadales bacterium]NIN76061.1 DUF1501 domain-containing protein [Xanthomonadales bacterium]NIO14369.1 DUF1501 domain-containing protein [Xanthomonadales bacterium]NIP13092.1 DUF1501 domain-containing protein [Xanthomonadales bacterium]
MGADLNRREFLRNALYASLAGGTALGLTWPTRALAACGAVAMPRTLVNLMLYGGIDSRFVFMPSPGHPNTSYLDKLWAARENLYTTAYPDYASMFGAEYGLVADPLGGPEFGIHNSCGWLRDEFNAGRMAIVANSFCSRNRRHDQSQLNANVGEPDYDALYYDRDGWGGRLVEQLGADSTTVELSHEISVFGHGTVIGERLKQVVHAQDTRDIALPNVNPAWHVADRRNVLIRALKSYYEARGSELKTQTASPFNIFFQHNRAFREFGDAIEARLESCGPLPPELAGLDLYSHHFERQCRNLYDICLAPDILNLRTVSMRYDGWDTHNNQYQRITRNLQDVFGAAGGLATAMQQIEGLPAAGPPAREQLVVFVSSDFGRQLRANGDRGTDHGRGIYSILAGHGVNGGVYGDMFPDREALPDGNGRIPLETSGADIQGLTSTERILAAACEWMQPGSAAQVFPGAGNAAIEAPGLLDSLLAA